MPKKSDGTWRVSEVGCPDCAGVLKVNGNGRRGHPIYECYVGHRFTTAGLLKAKEIQLETSLWSALVLMAHVEMVCQDLLQEKHQAGRVQRPIRQRVREARAQQKNPEHHRIDSYMWVERSMLKGRTEKRRSAVSFRVNGHRLNSPRIKRDIIVIGGSAGAIEVLRRILGDLHSDLPAAIGIVLHRSADGNSNLASVLDRRSALAVVDAKHGMRFEAGAVYLAPCDHHMLVVKRRIVLNRGPKENSFRPSIDALFRSAAAYGSRAAAVLLTGGGDDGVDGMIAIKATHGLCLVQDPNESLMPYLPLNAIRYDHVDCILPVASIAEALSALATGETLQCIAT